MRSLALLLALIVSGCAEESPTSPHFVVDPSPASTLIQNEWQTWPIDVSANSCSPVLKSGLVDVHLVTTSRTRKDGSIEIDQTLNVRNGRLTDASGNEYVFGHNVKFTQVTLGNTYQADVVERFRAISKGASGNVFIDLSLRIIWDGSQLVVTSVFLSDCRG